MAPRPDVLTVDAGDELRLHVQRFSADDPRRSAPLVLLHGFTGSGETWRPLITKLRDRFPLCTVDLPGHGRSSAPRDPRRYTLDRFAGDLARVLDALDAERAVVLGYSFGGRAALKFALHHPDRLSALVLESTSPGIGNPAERDARARGDAELADFVEREGIAAFVDRWEMLPLWASQAMLSEASRGTVRAQRLAQSPIGMANALRGAGAGVDAAVLDRLGEIHVPVLLIAGDLDRAYVEHARRMAARLPRVCVEIVPGASHAVHLERPEEYTSVIRRFLANLEH